jgi:hypothetical protein
MNLDNPLTLILMRLMLLLLVGAGFVSSVSILCAYLRGARKWVKE